MPNVHLNRREFLQSGAVSLLVLSRVQDAYSSTAFSRATARCLSFYNVHTAEKLSAVYWVNGGYISESLADINHLLRDYRTGEVFNIEPRLLDTLCEIRMQLESNEPFELISGYRSPLTNAMLRSQGHGVAENSLHIKGMAADVRVPGRNLDLLRRTAISIRAGGVGYYPASQFVHVDVGRVRTW
jgi:uncharacterized protein YcbK (DUF882 family)